MGLRAEHRGLNLVYEGGAFVGPSQRMTSVTASVQYPHISRHALGLATSAHHYPDPAVYLVCGLVSQASHA